MLEISQEAGVEGNVLPPPTAIELGQAETVRLQVEDLLTAIGGQQAGLESNFVQLGQKLSIVERERYWIGWGFKGFSAYLRSIAPRVNRGRTQLYNCVGIAQDLLPFITESTLSEIGISKAAVLRRMLQTGKRPSPELITLAAEATQEELEAAIAKECGEAVPDEPGTWFSYGGAYLTEEQRAEFLRVVNLVVRAASIPVGYTIDDWNKVPSPFKREIFFCLGAEFLSGPYEAEVTGEAQ
jgi:hypothetical protein